LRTVLTVAIGVLLSFCLIYFARPISEWLVDRFSRGPRLEQESIAEVVEFDGLSFFRTSDGVRFLPIKTKLKLGRKDELKTERNGRIHLKMPSGYEIELLPESQLILDLWSPKGGPEYFSLTRGRFRLLRGGKPGQLYILQDSKAYLPEDAPSQTGKPLPIYVLQPSTIDKSAHAPSPTPEPLPTPSNRVGAKMPDKRAPEEDETLTSAYIETILGSQAPLFRRCQLSSLRDGSPSVGNLTIAFGIDRDGKTSGVRAITSNLNNKELETCATDVIERTRFKAYSGRLVQLSYPIEFR
jgi:hypothetical protein